MSRIPVGNLSGLNKQDHRRSTAFFPVVGGLLGLFAAVIGSSLHGSLGFSIEISALLAFALSLLMTGALHEDGLADSADGLGGARDRAKLLAILRDSRIGSYGAMALIVSSLLRFFAMVETPIDMWLPAFCFAGVCSRWTAVYLLFRLPYARTDERSPSSLASGLQRLCGWPELLFASVFPLLSLGFVFPLLPAKLLVAFVLVTLATNEISARYLKRRAGGYTGDFLGAAVVVSEIACLLVLARYS